jgi:hypothetical protein
MQDSDIEVIETGAKPKHAPVNNYEPKEPTAEELKLSGVTLVGDDGSMLYLTCDHCGEAYFPVVDRVNALDMNIGPISYGFQISTEKRRGAISCAVPLIFSAWRKDAYRANWRYRAGGDRILLPEPRAGACRRELRVGTDQRSCRHTRPRSEHERQRPGQTMRIVLVVQHEVARTSTAPYNEGSVRTFM